MNIEFYKDLSDKISIKTPKKDQPADQYTYKIKLNENNNNTQSKSSYSHFFKR
jgi:hypothetical protein